MPTTRVRYTSRTATQIREDLLRAIPKLAPSWTSHGEDEPGMALVDMLAGVADGLHYYFDKQALETFLPSVRLPTNAASLAHLIGYRPHRLVAAQGNISIITTKPLMHGVYIPARTQFYTQGGVPLVSNQEVYMPNGFSGVRTLPVTQGELVSTTEVSAGNTRLVIKLKHKDPSEQLFGVTTFDKPWVEFRDSQPEDPHNRWYHFLRDADDNAFVVFLQMLGNVPTAGTPIVIEYLRSQDIQMSAPAIVGAPSLTTPDGLTSTEEASYEESTKRLEYRVGTLRGYRARETVEQLRYRAPISIKTKHRAVSYDDYRRLGREVPGVKDLKLLLSDFYTRQIVAYVLMEDAVDPTQDTLDEIGAFLNVRNDLTLDIVMEPAVLRPFRCRVEVKAAPGHLEASAVYDVRTALLRFFRTTITNFDRTVRVSEVYNRANQPDSVAYINLAALHWDGVAEAVGDLTLDNETEVPTISEYLVVVPVTEGS